MYVDILNIANRRAASQDPQIFSKTLRLERFFSGGAICLPEIVIKLKKHFGDIKFSVGLKKKLFILLSGCKIAFVFSTVRLWNDGNIIAIYVVTGRFGGENFIDCGTRYGSSSSTYNSSKCFVARMKNEIIRVVGKNS